LIAELDGRRRDCERLAQEAIKLSPLQPTARSLLGYAHLDGRWINIEQIRSFFAHDDNYQEYLRVRPNYPDLARRQFDLGKWCEERRLTEQARAHYTHAIQINLDTAVECYRGDAANLRAMMRPGSLGGDAARRLGYKRVGEDWCAPAEYPQAQAQLKQFNKDYSEWKPKVERLRKSLSLSRKAQDRAREELRAIRAPEAVPALELVLVPAGEKEAILAAKTIGRIQGPEASLALARLAVSCEWDEARQQAARELAGRPLDEFVPALLASMRLPLDVSPHGAARIGRADVPEEPPSGGSQSSSEHPAPAGAWRRSTIFPFASSPHCSPITHVAGMAAVPKAKNTLV
jgi:tetratricopeptide (TPR) repeat protein